MRLAPGLVTPGGAIPWSSGSGGLVADILLDFVNNIYRVDGTTYATAALAGFTGTGTFDASGYTAAATQSISGTVDLPGDFIVLADYAFPSASGNRQLWIHESGSQRAVYSVAGTITTLPASSTSTSATRTAFGRSGGLTKTAYDGISVTTGGSLTASGSASLRIGNSSGGTIPFGSPIRKIAVYKQTLTDAQIQALT